MNLRSHNYHRDFLSEFFDSIGYFFSAIGTSIDNLCSSRR